MKQGGSTKNRQDFLQDRIDRAVTPRDRYAAVHSRLLAEFARVDPCLANEGYQEASSQMLELINEVKERDEARRAS